MPTSEKSSQNSQTFNTWLEHSEQIATIRGVSGRYGLDCKALDLKQAEQWTLRLLGVMSDMDKRTFQSNGQQFDNMDQTPNLNSIAMTRHQPMKSERRRPTNSAQKSTRSRRNLIPDSSSNSMSLSTGGPSPQQPRVIIPHNSVSQPEQQAGQASFSSFSPSSSYSAATPLSSASPQTPWLQSSERPMACLEPDPSPQTYSSTDFNYGNQFPASFQQHEDPSFGGQYQSFPPYMGQQQMYLDQNNDSYMVDDANIPIKHQKSFGDSFSFPPDPLGEMNGLGSNYLASPKGQMQWVNTYFDNYTYTDANTNIGANVHFGANRQADHSNYSVAGNSYPQGLALRTPTLSNTSQHLDFHIHNF